MHKVIVTGANGSGKSTFAAKLATIRPDVPVVSLDALKLTTNWQTKPKDDIADAVSSALSQESWIFEGGPSALRYGANRADAVVWLDPPWAIRAVRLALRPWRSIGKTRPELPSGNIDWPLQQYRFAIRSLQKHAAFTQTLTAGFDALQTDQKFRSRTEADLEAFLKLWSASHE